VGDGSALGTLLIGTPFGTITPSSKVNTVFTYTPKHKFTVGATYTLPLDESIGSLSIGGTWTMTSGSFNDFSSPAYVNGHPVGYTPKNNLVNANIDWRGIAGSPVDVSLFATNITKEVINVANTSAWNTGGVAEVLLNQPRMYGVRLRVHFGQ
jgi:iron complex outermembrane receptor protein